MVQLKCPTTRFGYKSRSRPTFEPAPVPIPVTWVGRADPVLNVPFCTSTVSSGVTVLSSKHIPSPIGDLLDQDRRDSHSHVREIRNMQMSVPKGKLPKRPRPRTNYPELAI